MSDIDPVVRHMLLCDQVERDAQQPTKFNVFGIVNAIRSAPGSEFPIQHPLLTVLLILSGGRGSGEVHIGGVHADSSETAFRSPKRTVSFGSDPLAVQGLVFRILDVPFPQPGLYWIQFCYNDRVIALES